MKINKLYLIAVGSILSNEIMAAETNDNNNDHVHKKDLIMTTSKAIGFSQEKMETKMFICPMHPEIIQTEMGSCPICGMDLIEKEKNIKKEINEILISQGMQQNINIKTKKAKMKRITPKIKSYGKIKYNEDTIIHKHLRVKGWVEKSLILKEGQYVKKGEKLFEIYSDDLIIAQQDFILTLKSKNKELIKRSKQRLKLLGIDNLIINELSKKQKVLYSVPFYADKSGYIKDFNLREGMYINENTKLLSIVNKNSYWVDGYVFEEDKNHVSIGSDVKISLTGRENYYGKIDYIYPELDPDTLSLKYRVTIDNIKKSQNLKPNMIVNMELKSKKTVMGLFIPLESLIQTENENRVVVKTKNGFIVKEVIVGFKNQKQAQILKGLSLNDIVVTSGQFLIDSEASIIGAKMRVEKNNE